MSWLIKRITHEDLAQRMLPLWWGTAWVDVLTREEVVAIFPLNHVLRWARFFRWRFLKWQHGLGPMDQHISAVAVEARQSGYDLGYKHGRGEAVPADVRLEVFRKAHRQGFEEGWAGAFRAMVKSASEEFGPSIDDIVTNEEEADGTQA